MEHTISHIKPPRIFVKECPCYAGRSLACPIHGPLSEPTRSVDELPHRASNFTSAPLGSESDSFTGESQDSERDK